MALARLALRSVQQRVSSSPCSSSSASSLLSSRGLIGQRRPPEIVRRFSATPETASGEKTEVAVTEGERKSKLFPSPGRQRSRRSLWRNSRNDFVPSLHDLFPSGLGNALMQATQHMNKLFENLAPSRVIGRMKEQDQCYKLRFEMPGLAKEDLKITVEDGVLFIKGEHKEEEEETSDDDHYWSATSFGYYDTSLLLPTDAKVDEIKAELKDGVLNVTIPRTEKKIKDVKEVLIQ